MAGLMAASLTGLARHGAEAGISALIQSARDPFGPARDTTVAARVEPSLPVTGAIAGVLNLLPVGYVAGILKHADFVASNVPGVPMPVYVAGSKVTGMFAFGPTIGTALNTTLLSYTGTCDIGINIDIAAVPDPDVLLDCLQESAAEITGLADVGPGR
jgi:diacylglycerol O-acyltransferase / wax synthase